jgi:neurexin
VPVNLFSDFYLDLSAVSNDNLLSYNSIDLAARSINPAQNLSNYSPFVGQMQQLIINGKSYFELINNQDLRDIVNRTVRFSMRDVQHKRPLRFINTNSWIKLPNVNAFHALLIQFHFKTTQKNGLIMYNDGESEDFIAVELVDGQLRFAFNLGLSTHSMVSQVKLGLDDNKWHLVSIWQSTKTSYELTVDSLVYKYLLADDRHVVLNLANGLYVGGLHTDGLYEKFRKTGRIQTMSGFEGCLASLEINKRAPNFDELWSNSDLMYGSVSKGCESKFLLFF